jgi:hypothetical protein
VTTANGYRVTDALTLGIAFEALAMIGGIENARKHPGVYRAIVSHIKQARRERRAEDNRRRARERAGLIDPPGYETQSKRRRQA